MPQRDSERQGKLRPGNAKGDFIMVPLTRIPSLTAACALVVLAATVPAHAGEFAQGGRRNARASSHAMRRAQTRDRTPRLPGPPGARHAGKDRPEQTIGRAALDRPQRKVTMGRRPSVCHGSPPPFLPSRSAWKSSFQSIDCARPASRSSATRRSRSASISGAM